ncbi:AMP-binding protein [Microcella frigidaquae]|uniref:O-succinylbenzoic acid--CoA ligase n=1 Tax=Microcella frigidaquae TaxID=424758 RepID=A0A840XJ12_9MICO|nr:O-succinylbenzoic acid--CoA ligase [Microcella frigidaquae]
MTRPLAVVDTADPLACLGALRDALEGVGPAVLFRGGGVNPVHTAPLEVEKRIALVVETSGTTGRPKRVALSADAVLASAAATEGALEGPGQWLLALPVQYIAGSNVLARSIAAGTEPVVVAPGRLRRDTVLAAIAAMEHPRRFTALVPAQLSRLVDEAEADDDLRRALGGFERILVGGQATPAPLIERAGALGWRITRTYGSSETCGGVVYDGRAIGQAEVRIVDGRVELGGPTLAEYYLGDPERTATAFVERDGQRCYRTDDAGELDERTGVLRVLGRLDDTIVTGGLKVRLGDVERIVREQPGLADAVVVAGHHPEWGEVPVVVTTQRPELDGLRRAVGARLAPEARPDRILTVDALPLLPSGKPDRLALARLVGS